MNKENCVVFNKNVRNNVIKLNRIALVDKNNRNEINNKINKSDTMNNATSNRVLRARTNPRLTEQYPLKACSRSTAKRTVSTKKSTSNINEIHLDTDRSHIKSVRVSLVRDKDNDKLIRTPTRVDVYEFQYDPKDEPPRKTKRRLAKSKLIDSDTSEDENNSMKDVMKKLRRRWRKPASGGPKCTKAQKKIKTIETPVRKLDQNKLITSTLLFETPVSGSKAIIQTTKPAEHHIDPNLDESADLATDFDFETDSSFCNPNPNVSILNKPPQNPKTLSNNTQNIDFDALFNISSQNLEPTPKPTQNKNLKAISLPDKSSSKHSLSPAKTAQDLIQEVMDSFVEVDQPKTPIKVYSNVLLQSPGSAIFNSTLTTPLASPWRLNLSNIHKHSYNFTVKKNSFTPAYDQDIIDHSRRKPHVYTNIGAESYAPDQSISETAKESHEKRMSKHSTTKSVAEQEKSQVACHELSANEILSKSLKTHQSSILSFMKSSKNHPSPTKPRQIGLFDEPLPDRPRKALISLNAQSTPFKRNTCASISDISAEKSSDDSMFGFSYLSDKENSGATKQKCAPARISLREIKSKPKVVAASGRDVIQTKLNKVDDSTPETSEIQRKSIEIDKFVVDDSSVGLFQDCEPELEVSKKINKNYTRKQPKRKRLPSVGSNHSDDESDDESRHLKKKQKDKLTKQEQTEVDRLAKHYNSMFEDIAKHHLIIE